MKEQPTKLWLEAKIREFEASILKNQGAINAFKWMLEQGIYAEEVKGEKEQGSNGDISG